MNSVPPPSRSMTMLTGDQTVPETAPLPMQMIPPAMVPPGRSRLTPSTTGFTLAQLESIALQSNPTLVQDQAQVDASLGKSLQAGLMPNPVLGYVSEQIGAGGGPGETQGGFIEQEIDRGGKLRLSRAKYRQEAVQAEMQVEAQRLRIMNGVRIKYFEVLAAQQHIDVERDWPTEKSWSAPCGRWPMSDRPTGPTSCKARSRFSASAR